MYFTSVESLAGGVILEPITAFLVGFVPAQQLLTPGADVLAFVYEPNDNPGVDADVEVSVFPNPDGSGAPLTQPIEPDAFGRLPGYVAQPAVLDLVYSGATIATRRVRVGTDHDSLDLLDAPTSSVDFGGQRAINAADATATTDLMNRRAADARYVLRDDTGMPIDVVQQIQPAAIPDGVTDFHAALTTWAGLLVDGTAGRLPPGVFATSQSVVIAPPANATVFLRLDGTIKKLASFADVGVSSGGLVIDGSAGGVKVYIEAPAHKLTVDGNQAAGATAVGIRLKGGATVVMNGGKYNNNTNGVYCSDAGTDVRAYDVEGSANISAGGGTGFTCTAGAKLRTYGNCTADGNEQAGFLFNNTAAQGCVLNGRARNNVTPNGNGGTGASLRSYGGRVEKFSAGGPGAVDGNGNGGLAIEFGGDGWDLGDLELFNAGNPAVTFTGDTHGNTTLDNVVGANGFTGFTNQMPVAGPDIPLGTTVANWNLATHTLTLSLPATGSHVGNTFTTSQTNPSGFGLGIFGATRCKIGRALLGMNSGYSVVLGRGTGPLATAISNAGAGILIGDQTIPCAGGDLPANWPAQGVLMIEDAFTVDITAGSRALAIDTGPAGAIPVPGSAVLGIPNIAAFTGDLVQGSFTVNNVSSFAGIVDGHYYNSTKTSAGTKIASHNVGANTITLDTKATVTGVAAASTTSTLPQTGTYVISSASGVGFGTNFVPAVGAVGVAVVMGAELVVYRGISGGSFISCVRGAFGSVAAAHPDACVVTQNPCSHHNQFGPLIGDSTYNWDKDPGLAVSGGSHDNDFALVDMTSVPAAVSIGEGAAGNDHNTFGLIIGRNSLLEIIAVSGGVNNRFDRIIGRDCAAGKYLLNFDATNWPVHDNTYGSLVHKSLYVAAPAGDIQNQNGATGNYGDSKLPPQLNAPAGRRYNYGKSRVPQNQANAIVSGTVYAFGGEDAMLPAGKTVTQISLWSGSTAGAGITHLWVGLVDRRNEIVAGVNTTDLPNSGLLVVSADSPGGGTWAINTEMPIAIPAFRAQDDMPYAVVFCIVATTVPTLSGIAEGNLLANIGNPAPKLSVVTSLTGRTVPLAIGANLSGEATFANLPYHEIVVS